MTMPWCRLHADFATDPKMQSVSETFQRRFVMLLCLQTTGDLMQLSDEEVACALRITLEEIQETKELFSKKGFINGDWGLKNWDKRQYKSDSSTERVQKYREKHKDVKRFGNVTVTPPDSDTDSDNSLKEKKRKTLIPKDFALTTKMKDYAKGLRYIGNLSSFTDNFIDKCHAHGYKYVNFERAWQTWLRKDIADHPENLKKKKVYV